MPKFLSLVLFLGLNLDQYHTFVFQKELLHLTLEEFFYNWNLKANNVLGNEYNNYGVSSSFCQQGFGGFCKRESYYPMPEQTFTFSLSRNF